MWYYFYHFHYKTFGASSAVTAAFAPWIKFNILYVVLFHLNCAVSTATRRLFLPLRTVLIYSCTLHILKIWQITQGEYWIITILFFFCSVKFVHVKRSRTATLFGPTSPIYTYVRTKIFRTFVNSFDALQCIHSEQTRSSSLGCCWVEQWSQLLVKTIVPQPKIVNHSFSFQFHWDGTFGCTFWSNVHC